MIADHDPEDVYDRGDPIPVRLYVVAKVIDAVLTSRGHEPARAERRRQDALRVLRDIVADVEAL